MNILFLGYWNADDPLTSATILPHLKILRGFENVGTIIFANTQREQISAERKREIEALGVVYKPLYSKNISINLINKVNDFMLLPRLLPQLIAEHNIQFIIARGAPAGGLAYLVSKKSKVPFVVESFEPHAAYMLATGTWKRYDPRYLYQAYLEGKQKRNALALITVSENYKSALEKEGKVRGKLYTVPCAVDLQKFYPDEVLKKAARSELNIPDQAVVGVYAGKFGGLYYEDEAFLIFKQAFDYIDNFQLLLLSSANKEWIQSKIREFNLPPNRCAHLFVPFKDVNRYLNAADFAFALYKQTSVAQYLSPVKVGEYWAVGLPVVLTEGVGDEYHILDKIGGGVIYKARKNESTFLKLAQVMASIALCFYVDLSMKYRSVERVEAVYKGLLAETKNESFYHNS